MPRRATPRRMLQRRRDRLETDRRIEPRSSLWNRLSIRRRHLERARAELDELRLGERLLALLELPFALEQHHGLAMHVERAIPIELRFELGERQGFALHPAREVPGEPLDPHVDVVLIQEAMPHDVELE